jgi:hypothetical protein
MLNALVPSVGLVVDPKVLVVALKEPEVIPMIHLQAEALQAAVEVPQAAVEVLLAVAEVLQAAVEVLQAVVEVLLAVAGVLQAVVALQTQRFPFLYPTLIGFGC